MRNKRMLFVIAALGLSLTGCATTPQYQQYQQQARPQAASKYSADKVLALSDLLPQLIMQSASQIDTSEGAQAMMTQLDTLGWMVYAKGPACIEELNRNASTLPRCYDYLLHLAAMMSVAEAAKPLMQRNLDLKVQTTGGFVKAGEVIAPVGEAMNAYRNRNRNV